MQALKLQDKQIVETMQRLHQRMQARIPQAKLLQVSEGLVELSQQASARARQIAHPIWWSRLLVCFFVLVLLAIVAMIPFEVEMPDGSIDLFNLIQVIEAGINDMVFVGIAIYFLVRIEGRIKRQRAVTALHELRSVAHVIDMFQLTKDPDRITGKVTLTPFSPQHELTPEQLRRYLDYCSEMLSIIAEIAALYGQNTTDAVVVESVRDVESVCNLLSSKIWQKLTIMTRSA